MNEPLLPIALFVLTLLAIAGSVLAVRRLRAGGTSGDSQSLITGLDQQSHTATQDGLVLLNMLVGIILMVAAGLIGSRWIEAYRFGQTWSPVTAHVDGLLLIATLWSATLLYLQSRPRMLGISAFGLPMLALILAWGVCASLWTYRPFDIHTVWRSVHLAGVYLGTLGAALAAISGAMFLYAQKRLKNKSDVGQAARDRRVRMPSLESLERFIQQGSIISFALLSLGIATGVVILLEEQTMAKGWWYTPKVILAAVCWGVFAVLINIRQASSFRGRRAAWLAIGGFVLLLVVYGLVTAGPSDAQERSGDSQSLIPGPEKSIVQDVVTSGGGPCG